MRVRTKIVGFRASDSSEKYVSLRVTPLVLQKEFFEESELMEDLYKIWPLTLETQFDEASSVINCQFDTLTDLRTAIKILELVFTASPDLNEKVGAKKAKQ